MKTFGIISEGPTDQIVIENILVGFFNDNDLSTGIRYLQPLRDATDAPEIQKFGGWYKVFEYCRSTNFVEAFEQNDYLVIQVDTDRCEDEHYNVSRSKADSTKLTDEELIKAVIERFETVFIEAHGIEKFALFDNRILYAISVNEIECWLLPLYFDDKTKGAVNKCVEKLNRGLQREFTGKRSFYIDAANKSNMVDNYHKLSKSYTKNKVLMQKCGNNISLQVFIQKITEKNIAI